MNRQTGQLKNISVLRSHFGVRRGIAALVFLFLARIVQKRKYESGDPSPHSKTVPAKQNANNLILSILPNGWRPI
jgi:hypothetical protein